MSPQVADVAVLVPARDEADSIDGCLRHVLAQDLGIEHLEVIVVDGASHDGTAEAARRVLQDSSLQRWVVHRNPEGSTPSNLNAGLALVRAPVVCRVDARSLIPIDYVRRCASALESDPSRAVVGGAQVARSRSMSATDRGIARALNNRWAMGMSRYRRRARSGPSDTVYLGAFRTEQLRDAGGWNEQFPTNQDFELNRRMRHHGSVYYLSDLPVSYLPRRSIAQLFRQYRRFGAAKVVYWRVTGDRPRPRQLLALGFVPALCIAALLVGLGGRRARRVVLPAGLLCAVVMEEHGATDSGRPLSVRLWSLAALGAVWSGWSAGAWAGLLRLPHRSVTTTRPPVSVGRSS